MVRTRLQLDADRHAVALRRSLAEDARRLREDCGVTQAAVARLAGTNRSVVSRIESGSVQPTIESYARIAAALGADLATRMYPNTGPALRDRHQVRMAELLIASLHARWEVTPEVAVRRPVRGWIDLVLHDPGEGVSVATELESGLRRIEQVVRWSAEKAHALGTMAALDRSSGRAVDVGIGVSRLLVVRWTRANRDVSAVARRMLGEAYPADPRDALDALTGTAAWPGPALVWARIDGGAPRLEDGWARR